MVTVMGDIWSILISVKTFTDSVVYMVLVYFVNKALALKGAEDQTSNITIYL
jgi:hypothetical protein